VTSAAAPAAAASSSSGVERRDSHKSLERRDSHKSVDDDYDVSAGRAQEREYLKEMLSAHTLWHNGGFWDKALWHWCIEQVRIVAVRISLFSFYLLHVKQLKTIPYDRAWHDMYKEDRDRAVRRVHSVIFSQVPRLTFVRHTKSNWLCVL
jgi:hypothetical protein